MGGMTKMAQTMPVALSGPFGMFFYHSYSYFILTKYLSIFSRTDRRKAANHQPHRPFHATKDDDNDAGIGGMMETAQTMPVALSGPLGMFFKIVLVFSTN
jgi:hypothetical protein